MKTGGLRRSVLKDRGVTSPGPEVRDRSGSPDEMSGNAAERIRRIRLTPTDPPCILVPTGWYVTMVTILPRIRNKDQTRSRLLDAALEVIRTKGYAGTSVDDICAAAGVTKGSFFHHFESKEALALAAVTHFGVMAASLFEAGAYRSLADPLDRVLGYIDLRIELLRGRMCDITCLLGTLVQETYDTHPAIRAACEAGMQGHIAEVTREIAAARQRYCPHAAWTAESLARHTQAVIQGALILAKAGGDAGIAVESLGHLRRYIEMLFSGSAGGGGTAMAGGSDGSTGSDGSRGSDGPGDRPPAAR